jgi:hypothetical protein
MHRHAGTARLFKRYVVHGIPFGLRLLIWALAYRLISIVERLRS